MPKRIRHIRRVSEIAAAIKGAKSPVRGADLCRAAGVEGPHRDPSLTDAIEAGVIRAVHQPGLTLRPASRLYLPA